MVTKKIRKGKKRWYPILAPGLFDNVVLGETYVYETEQIVNKHITVNLSTLSSGKKKQNVDVSFKVVDVKEGKGHTRLLSVQMQPNTIKRLARRGRSKIADSFLAKTKQEEIIRIKPVIITRTRADKSVQTAIRLRTREFFRALASEYSALTLFNEAINYKLQKNLRDYCQSVFPIRSVDLRFIGYEVIPESMDETIEEVSYDRFTQKKVSMNSLKGELVKALEDEEYSE